MYEVVSIAPLTTAVDFPYKLIAIRIFQSNAQIRSHEKTSYTARERKQVNLKVVARLIEKFFNFTLARQTLGSAPISSITSQLAFSNRGGLTRNIIKPKVEAKKQIKHKIFPIMYTSMYSEFPLLAPT